MNRFGLLLLVLLGFSTVVLAEPGNGSPSGPPPQTPTIQAGQPASAGKNELLDIKGPIEITDNSRTVALTAAATGALILLIALFLLWRKRFRKERAILAHATALQQLDRARQLIEEHRVDDFVSLVDQTLRRYIEQRFAVSACRQTTREFIAGITRDKESAPAPLAANHKNLQTWLEHCDLVKFARADLSPEAMAAMLANLRSFIESTRMEPEK